MRRLLIAAALLTSLSCVDSVGLMVPGDQLGELPVYSVDSPSHVVYRGSDGDFHYLALLEGDSRHDLLVRRGDAEVRPASYPVGSGRTSIVKSARAGEIELLGAASSAP